MTLDGARDFDFLHGNWRIDHRRLAERLAGCQDWEEFSTQMRCRPILGGAGNIDEGRFPCYHAMSLRLYDRHAQTWSIHWITSLSSAIDPGASHWRAAARAAPELLRDNTGMRTIALEEHFWTAAGRALLDTLPLSPDDKAKIAGGNAERLLDLKPA